MRRIHVVAATVARYLNCCVGVVRAFIKIPPLTTLAPAQTDPPFIIAQLAVLVLMVALGYMAVRSSGPGAAVTSLSAA